jgi:hypothetical protein
VSKPDGTTLYLMNACQVLPCLNLATHPHPILNPETPILSRQVAKTTKGLFLKMAKVPPSRNAKFFTLNTWRQFIYQKLLYRTIVENIFTLRSALPHPLG